MGFLVLNWEVQNHKYKLQVHFLKLDADFMSGPICPPVGFMAVPFLGVKFAELLDVNAMIVRVKALLF